MQEMIIKKEAKLSQDDLIYVPKVDPFKEQAKRMERQGFGSMPDQDSLPL